jgi:hypothetical protein
LKLDASNLGLFQDKEYEIMAEVGMGICLPSCTNKFRVKIKIGEFELLTSDPKEFKNGYNRWSERFPKTIMKTKYQSVEEMDKIFIYLMWGNNPGYPVCFWKGKVS